MLLTSIRRLFCLKQQRARKEVVHEPSVIPKQSVAPTGRRPRVYVPPSPERIEKFAFAVCRQLSKKRGENYCDIATVYGFTSFIKTIVSIKTKSMNAEVDHGQQKESNN
jgi:hypothetical protein